MFTLAAIVLLLVWYCKQLINRIHIIVEDVADLRTFEFSNSLPLTDDEFEESLHELEQQYGKEKEEAEY